MLARDRALEALERESFDVLVIGGGITGRRRRARRRLARLQRGARGARPTTPRGPAAGRRSSSTAGLRYLQNFDLGLVREALLERSLMVKLAPHLVRPLQMVVPAFGGARPDRLVGIGLNMYDVMAAPRCGAAAGAPSARRGRRSPGEDETESDWSPARHRMISGEEVVELLPGARRARPHGRLPVLRLPDRRRAARADRARRGRAVRRDLRQPPRGDRAAGQAGASHGRA